MSNTTIQQKQICEKFGADFFPADVTLHGKTLIGIPFDAYSFEWRV
ncbi:hypothetical protein [Peribacillus alkalitolerans]|nr:hypothetical protein [Peribacillus alkalitolerans]